MHRAALVPSLLAAVALAKPALADADPALLDAAIAKCIATVPGHEDVPIEGWSNAQVFASEDGMAGTQTATAHWNHGAGALAITASAAPDDVQLLPEPQPEFILKVE